MKAIPFFFLPFCLVGVIAMFASTDAQKQHKPIQMYQTTEFYHFQFKTLDGNAFPFEDLRGKRILIVNTASECGYTPQYAQLQELHESLPSDKTMIIGIPSNDFGGQEPGSHEDIVRFCQANYGVTFPMLEKVEIKGENPHPLYQWLCQKEKNGRLDAEVTWNFCKFLIDEQGQVVAFYPSAVEPLDERVVDFLMGTGR